jgi:hypothetical protein
MAMDLEPAGALATAGLVAKEIEGDAGKAHADHGPGRCANCNAQLAGAYCHQCGQPAQVHRSLLHIVEEAVHGVLHFDTKSWRTLPLLIARPGLLTRRYIDGQRARYVSPLALFLFSVFLMFFVFSMISGSGAESPARTAEGLEQARKELTQEIESERKLVVQRRAELAQAKTAQEREEAQENLSDAQEDLTGSEMSLAAVSIAPTNDKGEPLSGAELSRKGTNVALEKGHLDEKYPRLAHIIRHAVENPDLTFYKLKNSAYKFAFMLVPISLPFLWLMFFWRKEVTLYDHAIFTLYSLSFMSLWFCLVGVMSKGAFSKGFVDLALMFPPIHIFLQLKETYRLGWFSTIWRTVALLVAAGIIVMLFALLVLFISRN